MWIREDRFDVYVAFHRKKKVTKMSHFLGQPDNYVKAQF